MISKIILSVLFSIILLGSSSAISMVHADGIIATIPVGDEPWGIAVNPTTNKIYVTGKQYDIVSVIGSNSQDTTPKSGSGSSGDTTPPTLAFENDSFSINDNIVSFDDNLTAKVETGKPTPFSIKLSDNGGPDNIRHVSLYLNHHGENILNDLTETAVIYDKYSDLEILDPYNLISSADIDISQEGNHSIFTIDVVFSDKIETSDVLFRIWDMKRNPLNLHVPDALQVVLAEPTEEAIVKSEIIPSESINSEPKFSMKLFDKWAGYSSDTISDKEFLEHIKIDGEEIPSWVKKNYSKWVKEGLISHEELVSMLNYLKTKGTI